MRFTKYALLSVLVSGSLTIFAEVPSAVAIKDAHVVTVSGADMPRATVVMRKGLIEAVGADAAIPNDAWVIEGAGLTVYPGLIDGLSTWGIPQPPPGVAHNGPPEPPPQTRVGGPEDRPQNFSYQRAADLVSPSDSRLEMARAAGFTSAATFPNRGIIEGLGALISLSGDRGRDMVVAQPIGQQIQFRVGGSRSFPSSLMGNIAYVRQLYLDLGQYEQANKAYSQHPAGNKRPAYDHTLEGLSDSPRLLLPAQQSQQIVRMLAFGKELNKPFVLYGMQEAFRCVDSIKQANTPVLVSLKWPERSKSEDPAEAPELRELEVRSQASSVPGLLAKASVPFGFYSDGIDNAADLRKAVKKAIDAGLSRADAIKALTLNTAQIYGVADRLGSVDTGKIANLFVTRGEAFDDKSTVQYVFIEGKLFEPSKEEQKPRPHASPNTPRESSQDNLQERGN
jgi:hypothetical protein